MAEIQHNPAIYVNFLKLNAVNGEFEYQHATYISILTLIAVNGTF